MSATESDDRKLYGDLEEQGFNNEIVEGPVEDWATDFDHLDEVWAANPYPILDGIRESGCPIAHTDRYGGAWLPTTHEDVAAVAYDTDRFSSRMVVVGNHRPPFETAPQGVSPPISSDPPFHHDARRLLLPAFAPKAIERAGAGHPRVLPLAAVARSRARTWSTRPSSTRSTSRCG